MAKDYLSTSTPGVILNARKVAQYSKSSEVLANAVANYGYDFEVSIRAVDNSSADASVWKLSMERAMDVLKSIKDQKPKTAENDKYVRWLEEGLHVLTRILAQRVGLLEDLPCTEKFALMKPLAYSSDFETRKNLARHTQSEEIKVLLYRSSANHEIKGICLKRIHDMATLQSYISKLSGESLYKYADSILRNTHLTKEALKSFIEASVMLDNEHIDLIVSNANYNEDEFSGLLSRFIKPTITNK